MSIGDDSHDPIRVYLIGYSGYAVYPVREDLPHQLRTMERTHQALVGHHGRPYLGNPKLGSGYSKHL